MRLKRHQFLLFRLHYLCLMHWHQLIQLIQMMELVARSLHFIGMEQTCKCVI